jgi:hypothetical protein
MRRTRPTSSTIPVKRERTGTWEEDGEEMLLGTGESEKRSGGTRSGLEEAAREANGSGDDAGRRPLRRNCGWERTAATAAAAVGGGAMARSLSPGSEKI